MGKVLTEAEKAERRARAAKRKAEAEAKYAKRQAEKEASLLRYVKSGTLRIARPK